MKKKQILIWFVIVVVVIILGVVGYFGSLKMKATALRDISQNQKEFSAKDNFHLKMTIKTDEVVTEMDCCKKGAKEIIFANIKKNDMQEPAKMIVINDGETKSYCENNKEEIVKEIGIVFSPNPLILDFSNSSDKEIIENLKFGNASIKKAKYSNRECYIYESENHDGKKEQYYLDKETGLVLKYTNSENECEYEYEREFDCVDDSIFTEVDLSGYTLMVL